MDNFIKIYETHLLVRANLAKAMLEGNGIKAVIINKIDSQYQFIRDKAEVYVSPSQQTEAALLIADFSSETV